MERSGLGPDFISAVKLFFHPQQTKTTCSHPDFSFTTVKERACCPPKIFAVAIEKLLFHWASGNRTQTGRVSLVSTSVCNRPESVQLSWYLINFGKNKPLVVINRAEVVSHNIAPSLNWGFQYFDICQQTSAPAIPSPCSTEDVAPRLLGRSGRSNQNNCSTLNVWLNF